MIEELPKYLENIINKGEGTTVEFKEAKNKLPTSLFETICAMLNRNGGHIFLGVKDNGIITGVYKNNIKELKKDFANLCNNPEKVSPTVHLEIKEYIKEGKHILYIFVHESSDVHKTSNKIYDRNEDGDFEITKNTSLVSSLYIRKSSTYIENKIFPYATIRNLRTDLIDKARKMAINRTANHPWSKMDDLEMLRSAALYEKNLETGEEGLNLACILLFGKDEIINSVLPYYKTDAILKIKDCERYDDRDDVRTNLIESYERLTNFIKKHLNEKFYIEGEQRINIRDVIARELCANLLIHREYSNPFPAKLIITNEKLYTENANKPRTIGYIDLNNYSPYPKNPKIANFFKEIGLAEELGSGIKKIAKYAKIYSGEIPTFEDNEIFKVNIPTEKTTLRSEKYIDRIELRRIILEFIIESNGKTRKEINDLIYPKLAGNEKDKNNQVRTILTYLKNKNYIENKGTDTKSMWVRK